MNTKQSFHNTLDLFSQELYTQEIKCKGQELKVYKFFKAHPDKEFNATEVMQALGVNTPLTSWRRALSNLSNPMKYDPPLLVKTDTKRMGDFGLKTYCWKLNKL